MYNSGEDDELAFDGENAEAPDKSQGNDDNEEEDEEEGEK